MSRVHDMGGRFGDPAVRPDRQTEQVFQQDWHARALALTLACGALGQWNIDTSRHARERLSPKDYTRFSYYEKWIAALANLLVEKGIVGEDELATGRANGRSSLASRRLEAGAVEDALKKGSPADRKSDVAQVFVPGDRVRTNKPGNVFLSGGHTRLPRYADRANGVILRCHGAHVFPDASAHGQGEAPEPLYTVAFRASELWPAPEHPGDEVMLDLWQSYLEPHT